MTKILKSIQMNANYIFIDKNPTIITNDHLKNYHLPTMTCGPLTTSSWSPLEVPFVLQVTSANHQLILSWNDMCLYLKPSRNNYAPSSFQIYCNIANSTEYFDRRMYHHREIKFWFKQIPRAEWWMHYLSCRKIEYCDIKSAQPGRF